MKNKNINLGQVSFILAVIVMLYIFTKTIIDFSIIQYRRFIPLSIERNTIFTLSLISFICSIIAIRKKIFNKKICVFSVFISGSVVIPIIIGIIIQLF